MKKENIPIELHHLLPLVEKWGIGDDGDRDMTIENAEDDVLRELVHGFSDADAGVLNKWLADPKEIDRCTEEYLQYSAFFLAYEYAESVLRKRHST